MSLLDRLEFGGVELLVEIGAPLIGDTVETTRNPNKKAIVSELRTAISGVASGRAPEVINRLGSQIPVFADQFEDSVVRGHHPVRILSHVVRWVCCYRHMATDYKQIVVNCT